MLSVQQLLLVPRRELQELAKSLGLKVSAMDCACNVDSAFTQANQKSSELARQVVAARNRSGDQETNVSASESQASEGIAESSSSSSSSNPELRGAGGAAVSFDVEDTSAESLLGVGAQPTASVPRENHAINVMDLFPKVKAAILAGPARRVPVTPPVQTRTPNSKSPGESVRRLQAMTPKTPATSTRTPMPSAPKHASPGSALKQALIDERTRRRSLAASTQWEKMESRSKPGRFYWYNGVTKETRWTLPT